MPRYASTAANSGVLSPNRYIAGYRAMAAAGTCRKLWVPGRYADGKLTQWGMGWDSLAEAHEARCEPAEAIAAHRRSLRLDESNDHVKAHLKLLGAGMAN
ncbi:hypothetical protein GCM10022268_18380 [Sphingomonas cynarae]|uniref:Uncharacterized protein n=1 Tax=Sphingomonas cynarae TaxID=930197 RepID=A0ABP7DXP4_9SPHN